MIPWVLFNPSSPTVIRQGVVCLWAINIGQIYRYYVGIWRISTIGRCIVLESGSVVLMPKEVWYSPIQQPNPTRRLDSAIDVDATVSTPTPPALNQ